MRRTDPGNLDQPYQAVQRSPSRQGSLESRHRVDRRGCALATSLLVAPRESDLPRTRCRTLRGHRSNRPGQRLQAGAFQLCARAPPAFEALSSALLSLCFQAGSVRALRSLLLVRSFLPRGYRTSESRRSPHRIPGRLVSTPSPLRRARLTPRRDSPEPR